jgi:hypothetical protein
LPVNEISAAPSATDDFREVVDIECPSGGGTNIDSIISSVP